MCMQGKRATEEATQNMQAFHFSQCQHAYIAILSICDKVFIIDKKMHSYNCYVVSFKYMSLHNPISALEDCVEHDTGVISSMLQYASRND